MTRNAAQTAADIIKTLRLAPHPEGGWFRETWRSSVLRDGRASGTAIYYLLERGQRSHWHRVDAAEIWHFYAGTPLVLSVSDDGESSRAVTLGADVLNGETPQAIVAPGAWQSAETQGDWTLVGCTVSPGFEFSQFELAPPEWSPGRR